MQVRVTTLLLVALSSRKSTCWRYETVCCANLCRVGPCDVTKKEDLERVVQEIQKKEKYINLLGISSSFPVSLR